MHELEGHPTVISAPRRVARDAFAAFVGFGRGIWLFPLDTMFRTVGLRYGWLKALHGIRTELGEN